MHRIFLEGVDLTAEHKRVLKRAEIGRASGSGIILHDFDALLDFIGEREMWVTPMHQLLRRDLPLIDARLAHPIEHRLKRPLQKSFPHIHGLYLLVRASGLTYVDHTGSKPRLRVDQNVYQVWRSLNPTEQYAALLETWLLRAWPEIIGERQSRIARIPENFERSIIFFNRIPREGLPIAGARDTEGELKYIPEWHNLGLLDLFGLVELRRGVPEPSQGFRIDRVFRTPFGEALLILLYDQFFRDSQYLVKLKEGDKIPAGVLQPVLQPYFPEWRNNLSAPKWIFRKGAHVFKVTLGGFELMRRIAIPAGGNLDALASAILEAIEFDHDHLYRFSYWNRFGVVDRVSHPALEDGPWTNGVLIGDGPLGIGQPMTFLYDFGDWWEFDVTLERVDPAMDIKKPVILESQGAPPGQYPRWDEYGGLW